MQATMTKVVQHTKWWNQEAELLALELEKAFKNKFQTSYISVRPASLGYAMSVFVTLGANADEYHHRIDRNDPMCMIFHVYGFDRKTGEVGEAMEIVSNYAYLTLPPVDKYLFCSHKNTFRKISGNTDKLVTSWKKYMDKLHGLVAENAVGMQKYTPVNIMEKLSK